MPEFICESATDEIEGLGFIQTVRLVEQGKTIAICRWHAPMEEGKPTGVVNLTELFVQLPHRRAGYAGQLLRRVIAQASEHLRMHGTKLRRMWMMVAHKQHIIGRAFLLGQGFHHIATVPDMFQGQDALVYMRSFD